MPLLHTAIIKSPENNLIIGIKNSIWGAKRNWLHEFKPDDYLLVRVDDYIVALGKIIGKPYTDSTNIWPDHVYPYKVKVDFFYYLNQKDRINYREHSEIYSIIKKELPESFAFLNCKHFSEESSKRIIDIIKSKPNSIDLVKIKPPLPETAVIEMEFKDIQSRVIYALLSLKEKDMFLLENNLNERTISHKFAEYLQAHFSPVWDVDCEYNRNHDDVKRLKLPIEQNLLNHPQTPLDVFKFIFTHELVHVIVPHEKIDGKVVAHPPKFCDLMKERSPEKMVHGYGFI